MKEFFKNTREDREELRNILLNSSEIEVFENDPILVKSDEKSYIAFKVVIDNKPTLFSQKLLQKLKEWGAIEKTE